LNGRSGYFDYELFAESSTNAGCGSFGGVPVTDAEKELLALRQMGTLRDLNPGAGWERRGAG